MPFNHQTLMASKINVAYLCYLQCVPSAPGARERLHHAGAGIPAPPEALPAPAASLAQGGEAGTGSRHAQISAQGKCLD